jgi:WD40 repeat protein
VGNNSSVWSLGSNKSPIQSLCFDTDEQYVVSGTQNGSIKVFDLNEGRLARHLAGHQVNVSCLQYHAFGEFIVSGSFDCTMKVLNACSPLWSSSDNLAILGLGCTIEELLADLYWSRQRNHMCEV